MLLWYTIFYLHWFLKYSLPLLEFPFRFAWRLSFINPNRKCYFGVPYLFCSQFSVRMWVFAQRHFFVLFLLVLNLEFSTPSVDCGLLTILQLTLSVLFKYLLKKRLFKLQIENLLFSFFTEIIIFYDFHVYNRQRFLFLKIKLVNLPSKSISISSYLYMPVPLGDISIFLGPNGEKMYYYFNSEIFLDSVVFIWFHIVCLRVQFVNIGRISLIYWWCHSSSS